MIERINLLPPEYRGAGKIGPEIRWAIIITLAVCVLLGSLVLTEIVQTSQLERRRDALVENRTLLETENRRLTTTLQRMKTMEAQAQSLRVRLQTLSVLEQEKLRWSEVLTQISFLVPDGAWLTSLGSFSPTNGRNLQRGLRLKGKALSHERVSDLLGALEKSRGFREVELIFVKRGLFEKREIVDFELACEKRWIEGG